MVAELGALGAPLSTLARGRLLAERATSPRETGAAVAALDRQLSALLMQARATFAATPEGGALDELKRRRDQKREGSS